MEANKVKQDDPTNLNGVEDESTISSGSDTDPELEEARKVFTARPSEKRNAENSLFSTWLSKRTAKKTKQEVQSAVATIDEEALSARALMAKQDFTKLITDPREYQLELFERAKDQNTIAVLDTGSGKTLIAVLLLKHMIDIELEDRRKGKPPKISFFLADCVTLVFQQAAVLDKNLDQKIDRFCGDMGTDFFSAEVWHSIFTENMVIVCTPDILIQCIEHAFITMDQINLLIFDEAHHAKKNHAYARLIKDFYVHCSPLCRPKVFGMTASPVDAKEDPVQTAKELEIMLHSQIATASDLRLLRNCITRPNEVILEYPRLEPPLETHLCSEVHSQFGDLVALRKHFVFAEKAFSQLGKWCSDLVWRLATSEDGFFKLERKTEKKFLQDPRNLPISFMDAELEELKRFKEFVTGTQIQPPNRDRSDVSGKALSLLEYLDQAFLVEKHLKCIIFVEERWTARLLKELLHYLGPRYLSADLLIGSDSGEAGDLKVTFRKQLSSLNKFRKGDTNCLIATSIAEEGLDIPDCNLVIRFDLYKTLIQYIQSRGRARHVDSTYVHMLETRNQYHLQLLKEIQRAEEKIRNFCEALPKDRLLQGSGQNPDFETTVAKERAYRRYTDPETKATLTYASSLVFLAHFVASLPSNGEDIQQPVYHMSSEHGLFVCEVILPDNSPIHSASGLPATKKATARRSAAFEACLLLRQKGHIDNRFISTYHRILPQMRNARLALTTTKTKLYDMKLKPNAWSLGRGTVHTALFATVLELERPESLGVPCRPLILLTRTKLPDFPSFVLNLQIDNKSALHCFSRPKALRLESAEMKKLETFTLRIFRDVFNKLYENDESQMSYWLAPAIVNWRSTSDSAIVDWPIINDVFQNDDIHWDRNTPPEAYVNRYLIDRWDGGQRYYSIAVEPGLCAKDAVPKEAAKHRYMDSIIGYTVSLFAKSRARATWIEDQPVLRAQQLLHRLNWLDDFTEAQANVNTKAWVCLQPLQISALPISVVSMARMFPGIITRLESYLIALEAFEDFGLQAKPDLALEAMTKDSDNTEEHRTEQIQFQRGMGKNYERLEFIGDCFLKMATSISLFSKCPEDNEFEYHVNRMLMICNKNLRETALKKKLYESIRTMNFSRRYWYPQGLKLLEGKGKNKTAVDVVPHDLSDKTIADVCEAMIGACLLSYNETGNVDMAVRAVTALVSNQDHDVLRWADYYFLYEKPKYQTAESTASHYDLAAQVEKKHSYQFKWPRLLRSAFIHPSQPFAVEKIPCYQRLEFLGDALLDMASINFLYHRHPDRDPQWLTEHKMAMVSNKFLAALSVKLGFHKHLRYSGAVIEKQNRDYATELEEAEADSNGARDYWTNTKQPPKALSDILEAYVGAIFVDSEYNYSEVERFFNAHMRWFFEDMSVYDTFANNHPTTYLHKLLTLTFGCTEYRLMANEIESVIPGGPPTSVAVLMVHGEIVVDGEASSTKNAKVKASSAALKLMQGLSREEYRVQFRCQCKGEEKDWVGKDGDGVGMVGTAI